MMIAFLLFLNIQSLFANIGVMFVKRKWFEKTALILRYYQDLLVLEDCKLIKNIKNHKAEYR